MKHIKCWDCLYLGNCNNCSKNGCNKFFHYKIKYEEIAKLLNISTRTLYRWFSNGKTQALNKIYNLTGYRLEFVKSEKKKYLKIINKE